MGTQLAFGWDRQQLVVAEKEIVELNSGNPLR